MAKVIAAVILVIASVAAIEAKLAEGGPSIRIFGEPNGSRNLLLNALGTRSLEPGQVRIPIPVDGVVYEVVVSKPGEPRYVPIAQSDAE